MRQFPHGAIGKDPELVKGAKLERAIVRRVWKLAAKYKRLLVAFVASILLSALVAVAPPLVFRELIDKAIPEKNLGLVNVLALTAVALALADAALAIATRWYSARIGEGVIYDLRVGLFDHVQTMSFGFFTRARVGSLMSRLNNDVVGAQQALTSTLGQVISNSITLAITFAVMLGLEWRLTILALALLPIFMVPAKFVGRKLQRLTREQMVNNADMNAFMQERLDVAGALLVSLFGNRGRETNTFSGKAASVRDTGVQTALLSRVFFVALGVVGAVGVAVTYWLGARMVVDEKITVGTIVAFAAYAREIYTPLTAITNARVDVMSAFVSFDRVFEVLDFSPAIAEVDSPVTPLQPAGRVSYRDVNFRFPDATTMAPGSLSDFHTAPADSDWVLRNIDLEVRAGSTVAIVGSTGAGKSTLASLVSRIWDPTSGSVLIDGFDVAELKLEWLRSQVGVVSQDVYLFHDTIRVNLTYGKPDATPEQISDACRRARILDLIEALPQGFETLVGERGYRMSGGEKQRLAIARMLLKDPLIVVLDEATAHLDSETEALVQQALKEVLKGRTAIVVAHRLSTVVDADEIVVLSRGTISERGTHSELLERDGFYAELFAKQIGDTKKLGG